MPAGKFEDGHGGHLLRRFTRPTAIVAILLLYYTAGIAAYYRLTLGPDRWSPLGKWPEKKKNLNC